MTITAIRTTVNTAPLTASEERRKHKLSSTHTISYTCRTLIASTIFWSTQLHVCIVLTEMNFVQWVTLHKIQSFYLGGCGSLIVPV